MTSDLLTARSKGYAVVAWVPNTERRFGSAPGYLCVRLTGGDGRGTMMLTLDEVSTAIARAEGNREDVPRWTDLVRDAEPKPTRPSPLELRVADLQDLACKVLAVLEDEPMEQAVPLVIELLNEHLEAGDLTLDFARLGTVAAVIGSQDEQADLLEALADELERMDSTGPGPGQTDAIAEDLAERPSFPRVQAWLARLLDALRVHHPPQPAACRVCGCTDADCSGCVERTGGPCYWVDDEHTLCSSCLDAEPPPAEATPSEPATIPHERWCLSCFVWTSAYDPAFKLHNACGRATSAGPLAGEELAAELCDDGEPCTDGTEAAATAARLLEADDGAREVTL